MCMMINITLCVLSYLSFHTHKTEYIHLLQYQLTIVSLHPLPPPELEPPLPPPLPAEPLPPLAPLPLPLPLVPFCVLLLASPLAVFDVVPR